MSNSSQNARHIALEKGDHIQRTWTFFLFTLLFSPSICSSVDHRPRSLSRRSRLALFVPSVEPWTWRQRPGWAAAGCFSAGQSWFPQERDIELLFAFSIQVASCSCASDSGTEKDKTGKLPNIWKFSGAGEIKTKHEWQSSRLVASARVILVSWSKKNLVHHDPGRSILYFSHVNEKTKFTT